MALNMFRKKQNVSINRGFILSIETVQAIIIKAFKGFTDCVCMQTILSHLWMLVYWNLDPDHQLYWLLVENIKMGRGGGAGVRMYRVGNILNVSWCTHSFG